MKKGFLLTKSASKTVSTFFTTQVTPTPALKDVSSNCFHDVMVDFISGLIKRNPSSLFSSIITSEPSAIDVFLNTYKDQAVPIEKLLQNMNRNDCFPIITQFLATFLNLFLLNDENQEIFLWILKFAEYLQGLLDNNPGATPPRNVTPILVMPLTKSQKRSAKKKVRKEKKTMTVTFNQSLLSPPSTPFKQLKQNSQSQSTPIDNGKKLKQKKTDKTFKNSNVIITEYCPQGEEQAQLLDLVVYDILAK
ncbi:hypothetical protein RclHR1_36990001 [Rhizophagus clarus]|uniref:Uncharacterized protein n=1 Tax=Rhizophagus clarus TaxID=94130 RepID=A0A2Z6S740_9GLOM|nr:hypothetical protein RclHR1_36990001 [Rhizophagus clarus]